VVFRRHRLFHTLLLKPPQIGLYNDYLYRKLEQYDGWIEVFKAADGVDVVDRGGVS